MFPTCWVVVGRLLGVIAMALGITTEASGQARWTLTEAWRIGGADDGPLSFSYVKGIAVDGRGRVFVYDRSTQDIRLFDAGGKLLRVIGRKGSGPGEFRDAEGIAVAPNGKLWVRDAANARFAVFSGEGVFERAVTMTFCSSQGSWTPRMDEARRIIDQDCIVSGQSAAGFAIMAYHTDRPRVDTLAAMPECGTPALSEAGTWITRTARGGSFRQIPFAPSRQGALGKGAVAWCVPNSARFEIVGVSVLERDTVRIQDRVEPVPVSPAERDSVITALKAAGLAGLDFGRIPTTKPVIDGLHVDDLGRLWVRSTNAGGAIAFRVYDTKGVHVATAELGRYTSPAWLPLAIRGRSLYMVLLDEDDVPHVAHFRIGQ